MKILITAEFDTDDDGDQYKGMSFDQVAAEIKRESDGVPGAKFISVVKSESQENVNLADSTAGTPVQQPQHEIAWLESIINRLTHPLPVNNAQSVLDDIMEKIAQLRAVRRTVGRNARFENILL